MLRDLLAREQVNPDPDTHKENRNPSGENLHASPPQAHKDDEDFVPVNHEDVEDTEEEVDDESEMERVLRPFLGLQRQLAQRERVGGPNKFDSLHPFTAILSLSNVNECVSVESSAFPELERCSEEKVRLTPHPVCLAVAQKSNWSRSHLQLTSCSCSKPNGSFTISRCQFSLQHHYFGKVLCLKECLSLSLLTQLSCPFLRSCNLQPIEFRLCHSCMKLQTIRAPKVEMRLTETAVCLPSHEMSGIELGHFLSATAFAIERFHQQGCSGHARYRNPYTCTTGHRCLDGHAPKLEGRTVVSAWAVRRRATWSSRAGRHHRNSLACRCARAPKERTRDHNYEGIYSANQRFKDC